MRSETANPAETLKRVRDQLRQESGHIQIVGRALRPEEERRCKALGRAVKLLDETLRILGEPD